MAVFGTLMAIVSFFLLMKKKGKKVPLSYYASMIVGETLVLPMASVDLMNEYSATNIFAFAAIVLIIIVSAISLAVSKADE